MANDSGEARNGLIANLKMQRLIRQFVLFLTFVAFIFALTALLSCQLIIIKGDERNPFIVNLDQGNAGFEKLSFGYFQMAEYEDGVFHHCGLYFDAVKESDLGPGDSSFEAGKGFAILTVIFTFFDVLLVMAVMLFTQKYTLKLWWLLRVLLPLTLIFQCLSLLVYDTEICQDASDQSGVDNCVPDGAGVVQIINIVLLFLASLLVVLVPPPPHPIFKFWANGEMTVPETTTTAIQDGKLLHSGDHHSHASEEEVGERA